MKVPRTRKEMRPRNLAAKALGTPLYRPRVVENPKAYKRKGKYTPRMVPQDPADSD